jgi:predicted nucleic acid-binding Zn ribbon protein
MSWEPLPGEEGPPPRRVGESLDRLVSSLGMPSSGTVQAVFSRWEEVVGEQLAAHAWPVSLDGQRLVVAVDEPGWATQLRYLEGDLLRRLAAAVGGEVATRLEVRVRTRGQPPE